MVIVIIYIKNNLCTCSFQAHDTLLNGIDLSVPILNRITSPDASSEKYINNIIIVEANEGNVIDYIFK